MESEADIRTPSALRQPPAPPAARNKEMIPLFLIRLMFGMVLFSLVIVSYAVFTGREKVGQPAPAAVLQEKWIVLEGGRDGNSVTVRDTGGKVLLDLNEGGFITVIQAGLSAERRKHGTDPSKPIRIVEYANGRVVAEDPETGWSVELYAFGKDNLATVRRLLDL